MEEKKTEILNEDKLEKVHGGNEEVKLLICPNCGSDSFSYYPDRIDGIVRNLSHCTCCHHAFYFNEKGETVSLGQYC